MKLRKLSLEELPPVMLAFSGILGIGPMAVFRLFEGSYLIAALDTLAVVGFMAIAYMVYVKRSVRIASVCMAMVAIVTAVLSVNLRGGDQVIWMYPATIALFYLLKPREAALAAVIGTIAILPTVFEGREVGEIAVFLTSLAVTVCLSVAFAALTEEQRRNLQAISLQDPLTGTGNRRALDLKLDEVIAQSARRHEPFVLIMLDIDHFKSVNDVHGHAVGDAVLCEVADTIKAKVRPSDACFRAGGEEFVVVAAMSDLVQGSNLAERLRVAISGLTYGGTEDEAASTVTASFGLAEHRPGETRDDLYQRADAALYEAKRRGRNRLHSAAMALSDTAA